MEFAFIFILFGVVIGINVIFNANTPKSCKEQGLIHTWVNGSDGIYCEKCKMKPNQIITETRSYREDGD